jgi:hypothetical protein
MMATSFAVTRSDGKSNSDVVLALVHSVPPGHVFTYEELCTALNSGTQRKYTIDEMQNAVRGSARRLLREEQRVLHCIKKIGYRVALASDHNRLAMGRVRKADVQMKWGLETLKNVRWNEMYENTRKATEGTLMVVGAIYENQRSMEKRLNAVEAAIAGLKSDVIVEQKGKAG